MSRILRRLTAAAAGTAVAFGGVIVVAGTAEAATTGTVAYLCTANGQQPVAMDVTTSVDDVVNATRVVLTRKLTIPAATADALRTSATPKSFTATSAAPFSFAGTAQSVTMATAKTTVPATGAIDVLSTGEAKTAPADVAITAGNFTTRLLLDKENGTPATPVDISCQAPTANPAPSLGTVTATATSATTLSFNPAKPTLADTIQVVAKVTTSAGTPNGVVTFTVGTNKTNVATDATGTATLNLPKSTVTGPIAVKADFLANDAIHYDASSASGTVDVGYVATKTALTLAKPTVKYGENIVATAAVTVPSGQPAGAVEFNVAGVKRTVPVGADGKATLTLPASTVGPVNVNATFVPTNLALFDFSSASAKLTIDKQDTTTTLTMPPTANVGDVPVAVVKVTHGDNTTPKGTVLFTVSGKSTSVTLAADGTAKFTLAKLATPGDLGVVATYRPTFAGAYNGSTMTTTTAVTLNQVATTTALAFSKPSAFVGDTVTATATVSAPGGTPSGTVDFSFNGTVLNAPVAANGVATVTVPRLASAGVLSATATYKPATTATTSSTATGSLTVTAATTTTSASANAAYKKAGKKGKKSKRNPSALYVSADVTASNGVPASGTASVLVKGPKFNRTVTVDVSEGGIDTTVPISKRGTYTVTVTYAGVPNALVGSTSSVVSVPVK